MIWIVTRRGTVHPMTASQYVSLPAAATWGTWVRLSAATAHQLAESIRARRGAQS